MKRSFIIFIMCFSICFLNLFLSCNPPDPIDDPPKIINLVGYNMFPIPNTTKNVGYIFAVDRSGVQQSISFLNVNSKEGPVELGSGEEIRNVSFEVLGKFLGLPGLNLPLDAGLKNSSMLKVAMSVEDAIENVSTITELEPIFSENLPKIKNAINNSALNLANYDFYLITQVVKAKKVNYKFDATTKGDQNFKATFVDVASADQKFTWDNSRNYQLRYSSPIHMNVLYTVLQLDVESNLTGGLNITLGKSQVIGPNSMIFKDE